MHEDTKMDIRSNVLRQLKNRREGFSLEQPFYTDEDYFRLDMEMIYYRDWLFIGHDCELPKPGAYYDALRPLCQRIEIWHTIYNHVLADATAIVEWVKGTGLKPFVDPLEPAERKEFVREYTARVAAAYPPQVDGKVILRFPRFFVVAVK